ncbi:hypothetical protein [Zavarzinia compransoris]|uniref:DUF4149 domain-containing protein n=1 Tax=Zavarzinia compransoris TaxID=1264899 RepID=A0A317DYT2_9PROT|nr:hypothetical protein [Zavarzinia compransoris]PWR19917.1 hypothetical protein DKG75_15820 [Zavarzinia compransoris]
MQSADYKSGPLIAVLILVSAWTGLLVGVSFLATPVKFLAPSLTLPVALDVGRQTFFVFNRSEIVLAMSMLFLLLWSLRSKTMIGLGASLALFVLAQTVWMLPELDARVETILQDGALTPSSLHTLYVIAECMKLVLLLAIASIATRALLRPIVR